jgi:hypothetical protein
MQINIRPRLFVLDFLPKGAIGAEIGVHMGAYSAQILNISHPKKLYLIDPYRYRSEETYGRALYGGSETSQEILDRRYEQVRRMLQKPIETGIVELIRETNAQAARLIPDESLDYVYIDGDHSFDMVRSDIKTYLPKIKPNGLIIGDDYSLNGWWGAGVVKAFAQCLHEDNLKIEFVIGDQICCRKVVL